jgi:hypothetical protein
MISPPGQNRWVNIGGAAISPASRGSLTSTFAPWQMVGSDLSQKQQKISKTSWCDVSKNDVHGIFMGFYWTLIGFFHGICSWFVQWDTNGTEKWDTNGMPHVSRCPWGVYHLVHHVLEIPVSSHVFTNIVRNIDVHVKRCTCFIQVLVVIIHQAESSCSLRPSFQWGHDNSSR